MKKFLIALIVSGAGLAAGCVGFLFVEGFNVTSGQTWSLAFEIVKTRPGDLVDAAMNGPNQELFAGILGVFSGMILAALGAALMAVHSLVDVFRAARERRMVRRKSAPKPGASSTSENGRRGLSFGLPKLRRKDEMERVLDDLDEEDREKSPGLLTRLSTAIAGLKAARADRAPKAEEVVVWSGNEKSVIGVMTDHSDFVRDLASWYAQVRQPGADETALAKEARALEVRAVDRALLKVREEDPMAGELMIRMMRAWAARSAVASVAPETRETIQNDPDLAVVATAINDVMMNGVESADADEEGVDLDSDDEPFMSFDIIGKPDQSGGADDEDGDGGGWSDQPFLSSIVDGEADLGDEEDDIGSSIDMVEDDAGDEPEDFDDQTEIGEDTRALDRAFEFRVVADSVSEGADEWPEEFSEVRVRSQHLQSIFSGLHAMCEMIGRPRILALCEDGEGSPEWDWLREIVADIDAEKQRLMDIVVGVSDADGDFDDEGDAEIEAAFNMNPSQSQQAFSDDDDEAGDQDGSGVPDLDIDLFDDRTTFQEESEFASETGEDKKVGELNFDFPFGEEPAPEQTVTPAVEEVAAREPRDLSASQLDEIELSNDALLQWAYAVKNAGASEAKIAQTILANIGAKRRVVGVIQMGAIWKSDSGEMKRMNLLFRYVPDGRWALVIGDDVRMVEQDTGDFVRVDPAILDHDEVAKGVTVIHFHGPGVIDMKLEGRRKKAIIVSEMMSDKEIKAAVGI